MDTITFRPNSLPRQETKRGIAPVILGSTFVKIAFILVSALLVYNVFHSVDITIQKVNILKNARTEVEILRVTNLKLATQLQNMQSPEYIEVEARDRLNFSGNKDVVFVIPDSLLATAKERLVTILEGKQEATQETVMQKWENLIIQGV